MSGEGLRMNGLLSVLFVIALMPAVALPAEPASGPYARQVVEQTAKLEAEEPAVRAHAAEALGLLRAYDAESVLLERLEDESPRVRREVALALAWCGGRASVEPLIRALDDSDPLAARNAWVALTNLTGMEFPFDAEGDAAGRTRQINAWRNWWAGVPRKRPPKDVLALLVPPENAALGCLVTATTTYKGPPQVLTDGAVGPEFWQTKNVSFPQSCLVDLRQVSEIDQIRVHQYGPRFVMTEYAIETSVDGKSFDLVEHRRTETEVLLTVSFPPRTARFVRIRSLATRNPTYPTTFFEIEVLRAGTHAGAMRVSPEWSTQRGLRALGALGGEGACGAILETLRRLGPARAATNPALRPVVRTGIRALGRRRRNEDAFVALVSWLKDTQLARFAADALGDFGDRRAVPALLAAYPHFARGFQDKLPEQLPPDDNMKFPSEDRMYETPYAICYALSRLPLDEPHDLQTLRQLAPLLVANMPGDHDAAMLYQLEVGHMLTACLLEQAGLRQEACEWAFVSLGQPRRVVRSKDAPQFPSYETYRMSGWLPRLCRDTADLPRLIALLDHENHWVRLNAAKALAVVGDRRAIPALAAHLAAAPPEADYGYSGVFKDEEYNDPSPRFREAYVRALGRLGARECVPLLVKVLNDERSVCEVRHAAAQALDELGGQEATEALLDAARHHPIISVRQIAREACWKRGKWSVANDHIDPPSGRPKNDKIAAASPSGGGTPVSPSAMPEAVVFIKGENIIPNTEGTVEQADRWFTTYVVTDSGPTYRPGRNLYVLRPPRPDGHVTPLTTFSDGYVADVEVSWDGSRVLFSRRGQQDPWWHVFEIHADGTHLRQLTSGPYHDVGPAYLPDGRMVFSSSRLGIRDEYHGYPCTGLQIMDSDGSHMYPIAVNIGRDNEPALLPDGRIVFSRLEVFYARLKTELTLHAVHPDGTRDVVLYGPERRQFWRNLDVGPRSPAHVQEAPLTHRVLRMTQPQPMPGGRQVVCVTQGGLALVGPQRNRERIIPHGKERAFTTPFPLPDGRILCASTLKREQKEDVDVGLYLVDPVTGSLALVYNDPASADFEPRPLMARPRPPVIEKQCSNAAFTGRFLCSSVFKTQQPQVVERGRLVRVVEGMPVVSRHSTQTNPWPVWKNHHGTLARVLGTVPLNEDGSFYLEVPADRLLHLQVLDSDRRVVGNQLTWIYTRPGETKSCVGCHESPHATVERLAGVRALQHSPVACLPDGDLFLYRAKAWHKGYLPDPIEERTRSVRSVNLLAR